MLPLGGQTVTFVSIAEGTKDPWGIAAPVPTDVPVRGCRFRPLSGTEKVGLTDVATDIWRLTAPPVAVVMNAKVNDQIKYSGPETDGLVVTFEIDGGTNTFPDADGAPFKVTVLCKRQQKQIA
jgi:hypothetical protein